MILQIDWASFTPASAAVGGAMIGVAAVMFAVLGGRIAGISGIVAGVVRPQAGDLAWRLAFIAGLIAVPALYVSVYGALDIRIQAQTTTLIVAGLLVGYGSRLGSGCTSGHGVCGLGRRSPRSFVATALFMSAGFITVFFLRHLLR